MVIGDIIAITVPNKLYGTLPIYFKALSQTQEQNRKNRTTAHCLKNNKNGHIDTNM
jgi:hypothetical protein